MRLTLFLTILLTACRPGDKGQNNSDSNTNAKGIESKTNCKADNALTFINSYVDNCKKMKEAIDVVDWVNASDLATSRLKAELKTTIDEANKRDPIMGLDFDPIFNGQYYPPEGFELDSFDEKTNYLTVKGKDMSQFKVTMKIVLEKDKCLVDGCGFIGIPKDKRAVR